MIVTKSTVPVGTGDEIARIIADIRPDADLSVVSNPEFLREGAAIADFMAPDRVVIGTDDERAREVMRELYRPLAGKRTPILFTARRGAELIKYAANAFLATKITFINEIADLCEQADADVQEVAHGIGLDHRIGPKFLECRPRLRRLLLSQGPAGPAQGRARFRRADPLDRDHHLHQRPAQARHGAQGHRRVRRQHPGHARSPCWG